MPKVNYDEISKVYDDIREADVVLINHFLAEIPNGQALHILDLGCGTGNYTDLFQKITQGNHIQIHGIDPSKGMIDKARYKNKHIMFQLGEAENIPCADEFFDFIYMTDVIHHIPDIRRMFAEMYRVLKTKGKICIVTQSPRQIAARPIAKYFPGTIHIDSERYPEIGVIITAAQAAGLAHLKYEILFEGQPVELGEDFLRLVRKKGYSMLHLLPEDEYEKGLHILEKDLQNGSIQASMAGETLVWFSKE